MKSPLPLLALAGITAAQTTTLVVDFPNNSPDTENAPVIGSVVKVEAGVTTLSVGCVSGSDSKDCRFWAQDVTLIYGPSTFATIASGTHSDYGVMTESNACKIESKTADCQFSVSFEQHPKQGYVSNNDFTSFLRTSIAVTGGLEKLTATAGLTSDGATQTSTAANATKTQTSASTGEVTPTGSASRPGTTSAPVSTTTSAAGFMVTQNAVLAGVAAVVAGGMAL